MDRHMLCYRYDEGNLRFDGFFDCPSRLVSGHIDSRCIWVGVLLGLWYIYQKST